MNWKQILGSFLIVVGSLYLIGSGTGRYDILWFIISILLVIIGSLILYKSKR
ncbi:MAG: hypothetical protein GTN36_02340 [Candidatus Aenigmarchaeota archaeon]|nr:hypothetical protein [Candidatus Aenigmarchaeota archaeon]